jgi:hypothetical protein
MNKETKIIATGIKLLDFALKFTMLHNAIRSCERRLEKLIQLTLHMAPCALRIHQKISDV